MIFARKFPYAKRLIRCAKRKLNEHVVIQSRNYGYPQHSSSFHNHIYSPTILAGISKFLILA
jgi:hypothetical protein